MGPCAELGPLDVQIQRPDREDEMTSALDFVGCTEDLVDIAIHLLRFVAIGAGGEVRKITGLRRQDVLNSMLKFSSELMHPLMEKLDPAIIYRSRRELSVAQDYALRLMDLKCQQKRDDEVAIGSDEDFVSNLITQYPSHGFVISRQEAKRIGFPIYPPEEYELWPQACALHSVCEGKGETFVRLIQREGLQNLFGSQPDHSEEEAQIEEASNERESEAQPQDDQEEIA